ncbi:ribonuclease P protein component [Geodermatophilus amargosae]|uniref:ribonuclease P protein component n=1 Tax=Geodermatophilus amargosae TaxID=1296565 RepID=UPI0034DF8374
MLPAQARLRRRPEFTAVVRSGRRAGRPTMVLHFLPVRPPARTAGGLDVPDDGATGGPGTGPRAGFVVGRAVGNSVVRHRVTRRLRAVVREELGRLPDTADLVVRARPEAATATSEQLHRDLTAGLDRVLGDRPPTQRTRS